MASRVSITGQPLNYRYRYYGLGISIDQILWGTQDALPSQDILVRSREWDGLETSGKTRSARDWFRYEKIPDGSHHLHWDQIAHLCVSPDGRTIDYSLQGEKWHSTFCHHLLPQALSFSLLERGIDPLHGCVVEIAGSAVAFIGGPGRGKSTLAAHFWKKGHAIYSDDLVAIGSGEGKLAVCGGPPHLKLSRVTLEGLGISRSKASRFLASTAKYVLAIEDSLIRKPQLPLSAVYVLAGDPAKGIRIQTPKASQIFMDLTKNPFNAIQNDRKRWRIQFETANRLINRVPVRRLSYPKTFATLDGVYDRILYDMNGL